MNKQLRWKFFLILAVVVVSAWFIYPPDQRIKLGLDLKGGVHLVLKVQTEDALRLETEMTGERLRQALADKGISGVTVTAQPPTRVLVNGVPSNRDAEYRRIVDEQLVFFNRGGGSGGNYSYDIKPNEAIRLREGAVRQALQTIERRVNELGVAEPIVAQHGAAGDQILVQLPGVTDVGRAKDIIRSTALLELKIVEAGPAASQEALLAAHGGQLPADMEILSGADNTPGAAGGTVYYMFKRAPQITGTDLRDARPTLDENGLPAISFTMTRDGGRRFADLTGANVNRPLATILDHRVESVANIQERISDQGRITGNFTQEQVQDASLMLRSGALPAKLDYLEERTIGPTLGADSIRAGVNASLGGLALVAIFMLAYYKLAGINAIVSIGLNLVILLGLMSEVGAVMTLPGIAGFILTIGMGVDSNVLIFERIKEELAAGKGPRAAVAAGFDRVFLTILDTHVSSLISAGFLFQFGTGPIRGFATTLFFGLLSNVFTAVFVSRTMFELVLSSRAKSQASATMSI